MKIGVLGTGNVGRTIAAKLTELGHDVQVGSRTASSDTVTFADAAAHGELVFNCTKGDASIAALELAGAAALEGKVLIDVANPLDFSQGMPPTLTVKDSDSLAEQIQRALPGTRVVKALNTMNCEIMVNPSLLGQGHVTFLAGNDPDAKRQVRELLQSFGWADESILDLGDITTARGLEMYLPLWLRIFGARGDANFNIGIVG